MTGAGYRAAFIEQLSCADSTAAVSRAWGSPSTSFASARRLPALALSFAHRSVNVINSSQGASRALASATADRVAASAATVSPRARAEGGLQKQKLRKEHVCRSLARG